MTTISDLEKLIDQGKHVDLAPDGTLTVADKKPRPTIAHLLAVRFRAKPVSRYLISDIPRSRSTGALRWYVNAPSGSPSLACA
jgi:hypothetical protein